MLISVYKDKHLENSVLLCAFIKIMVVVSPMQHYYLVSHGLVAQLTVVIQVPSFEVDPNLIRK